MIERIFFLMRNPNATFKEYNKIFECSRRTFFRDKEYINSRLWNYKVVAK